MEYIAHKRFREIAACEKVLNIPYGTKLETIGEFIATSDGQAVCYITSENAHKHFARNDDGMGLERGALTYAIAYGKRRKPKSDSNGAYRFSDKEIEILERDWKHFLLDDVPVILFNHNFFSADVSELKKLADVLEIKVKNF